MSNPHAIYIEERAVHVQWDERGPFVTLHESGDVSVQYREPRGRRIGLGAETHRVESYRQGA